MSDDHHPHAALPPEAEWLAADPPAALAEILWRGAAIIAGERLVGGPRAVAFDLAGVAAKALGVELRSADVALKTWQPPKRRELQRRKSKRQRRLSNESSPV